MRLPARQRIALLVLLILLSGCGDGQSTSRPEAELHRKLASRTSGNTVQSRLAVSAFGFDYAADNKRLQALGIPKPATSAYFRALPDTTLESMAKAGDMMAKTFWVERLAEEALILQQARDANGKFPEGIKESDAVGNIGQMAFHLSTLEQDPSNAMAGYLWGLSKAASTYGGPHEPIVAGIRLAGLRGDDRAVEFEREFRVTHPNLNEADVEMYFESGSRRMDWVIKPHN
jgi:hypothetical protein